jgi:O-antigen/teichoic acid export membrane protein
LKKYILYGSSILFSKGLEYIVLLVAPLYLAKESYGELEFYKKIIELGTAVLTFGLPTLILSYPRSAESKKYFTFISLLFITFLAILLSPLFIIFKYFFLLIPIYFHSVFFNNGIAPPFILTYKGSRLASFYKIIVSTLFYAIILCSIFLSFKPEFSFVYVNYILLPILMAYCIFFFKKNKILKSKLSKYWTLFKKLITSSFTIVISNFANMMFLYTDIIIIKVLSSSANTEIADYSFSLNISNALILIPLTLVQVDIEKLKANSKHGKTLNKKIIVFVLFLSVLLLLLFVLLTHTSFKNYKSTSVVFIIIIIAKIFQSLSVLYGTQIVINKFYKENLFINTIALISNIVISYFLYSKIGLTGVALASLFTLIIRYVMLIILNEYIQRIK